MTTTKQYYSTIEVAKLLSVSVRTVQLWVESGVLEAWKTAGGHRRIVADSVVKLMNKQSGVEEAEPEVTAKRILIVEDNLTIMKFYEAAIESWGQPIEVISAVDGFAGLIEIGRSKPDLIITDIYMPGMDGLQMIRSLHKTEFLTPEQIVVISGLPDAEINERGGVPQGIDFFRKPVDLDKLKKVISKKLNLG